MSRLRPVRAGQIQAGDRITLGDHTHPYRVRRVQRLGEWVTLRVWWHRPRVVRADAWAWVGWDTVVVAVVLLASVAAGVWA